MNVRLVRYTPNPDELCAQAAAICTNTMPSGKVLHKAMLSGHESVSEHAVFTFVITGISRVTLAQLTRHRLASFSVLSQRYVDMEDWDFIIPDSVTDVAVFARFAQVIQYAKEAYRAAIEAGVPTEDARYILPQGIESDLMVSMNARELRHFFELRCCNRAQWEIREMADWMFRLCMDAAPALFAYCGPRCMTTGCREAKPCGHPRTLEDIMTETDDIYDEEDGEE